MFDNLFTSSTSVWIGLIAGMVALPILIHLINLMRHKTVKWAAMEFLLKSHKKNRNWVWLKQLFLLLSRIAALILALFMLAQIGCEDDRISRLLGGATTHHYVLLDDSFSMSDRSSGGSAFDRARSSLSLIGSRAKNRQNQMFSLMRYSCARPSSDESSDAGQYADLNSELVDNLFDQRIEDIKAQLTVSNLSVGLMDSLTTVVSLIEERENENAIVYIVSDFRKHDWENPTDVEKLLTQIHSDGAAIEMINCAKTIQPNLALTELEPIGNVRVAGTPLMMKLTVKNCSSASAEKVQVKLGSLAFSEPTSNSVPEESQPKFGEIPTVFIQTIEPGESQTRNFPVYFSGTGKHVVFASLPEDAVEADNQRWNTTEFSSGTKVLLIDDESQRHSSFMSLAISAGGMTGIEPEFRTKDFLRDTSPEVLSSFDVLFLLDLDTLDESAVGNLESFVAAGGGVAFFLGPNTNVRFYNDVLYRGGKGVFPFSLDRAIEVPEQLEDRVPDIMASQHPMFSPVLGGKNSLLDLVQVKTIVRPGIEWNPKKNSSVLVTATIRGNQNWPLAVEKTYGEGRVMAFTTTAGPVWNNWSRNATFPPIMLLMQDYLAAGKYASADELAGTPIEIDVSSNEFTPNATVLMPSGGDSRLVNRMRLTVSDSSRLVSKIGERLPSTFTRETDLPGIYDVWLRRTDSNQEVRRKTLNVDTLESEMELANQQNLVASLEASNPNLVDWDKFIPEPKQKPASSLSKLLLILLVSILVIEQLLAYSTSYHQRA